MSVRTLIQVVPHRTSDPDGIGDYAVNLASGLRDRHQISSVFVAGTPAGHEPDARDDWPTLRVNSRTAGSLVDTLNAADRISPDAPLLIHVCGYGYAPRGAPIWLAGGMRRWRAMHPHRRMIGIFHELYAKGPITSSSFWLSGLQKQITKSLWRLADAAVTPTALYAAQLADWRPDARQAITELPVPSNVGEPPNHVPLTHRKNRAVVFGRRGVEDLVYRQSKEQLVGALTALGVEEIIDIGLRNDEPPQSAGPISIRPMGRLEADAISRVMMDCRFGVLAYDRKRLGKSTIFAAYAAHGVIPICIGPVGASGDAPGRGRLYLTTDLPLVTEDDLRSIQERLIGWYRAHDQTALSAAVAACLDQPGGSA